MKIRFAGTGDAPSIEKWIKKIGDYQRMESGVNVESADIQRLLADGCAKVALGYEEKKYEKGARVEAKRRENARDEKIVAMAYFFEISSSFTGSKGIFIDALIVDETLRNSGIGKQMLKFIARYALDNDCTRIQWLCLDWNLSAMDFYEKIGATKCDNLITYRMELSAMWELLKV